MINKFSVRSKNHHKFIKVVQLRKKGFSYSEIRKEVVVAKSTINNWITLAGLNLSPKHLNIQTIKKLQNYKSGILASIITRKNKSDKEIQNTVQMHKHYFNDPFYNYGIALYEAEGSKGSTCKFSNSDYRLIIIFIKFLEKYFQVNKFQNLKYELFIHKSRKADFNKIISFWTTKLEILPKNIKVYWKQNIITNRRKNPDYVGQLMVRTIRIPILSRKILTISDIILKKYLRNIGGSSNGRT